MKTLEINDKHYIECKVVLLATDDKTTIWQLNESNHLTICGNDHGETPISREECNLSDQYIARHLYITSDEEIKEGDWCLGDDFVYKYRDINTFSFQLKERSKKIIATTDSSLTITMQDSYLGKLYELPQPSKEFIQSYIESYNNVIEDVLVEVGALNDTYKMLIKEGYVPKDANIQQLKLNNDNTIIIKKKEPDWDDNWMSFIETDVYKYASEPSEVLAGYKKYLKENYHSPLKK